MSIHTDVVIVGGGPAGIATAIAASARGLRTIVVEAQTPPIDKPCGEGLLPQGVAALRALGIHLNSDIAVPFRGIRFVDHDSTACAKFSDGVGYGLRRMRLNQLLLDRATQAGVNFLWDTRITNIEANSVTTGGSHIHYRWLVGADGQNSGVRKWARLSPRPRTRKRFAFRRHFKIRPWTDVVEVFWGNNSQIVITPTGAEEACVVAFSRNSRVRIDQALPLFPVLAERLRDATPTTKELGDVTALTRLPAVTRGRVALVGDASGTVDAITGHGLSLALQQALYLAEAFEQGNLALYESAHRKVNGVPAMMTHLMMVMNASNWIRRKTLRLFQKQPGLFSKLLSIHAGELPLSSFGRGEMIAFGWRLL